MLAYFCIIKIYIQFEKIMSELANHTIFSNWKPVVHSKAEQIITIVLQSQPYDVLKSKQQASTICTDIVKYLSSSNKNFKYITNCTIVAAGGNGFDMTGLCYWDNQTDGNLSVKWQSKYLTCILNIYACAI